MKIGSYLAYNCNERFTHTAPIDGTIQNVVQPSLQVHLSYRTHYPEYGEAQWRTACTMPCAAKEAAKQCKPSIKISGRLTCTRIQQSEEDSNGNPETFPSQRLLWFYINGYTSRFAKNGKYPTHSSHHGPAFQPNICRAHFEGNLSEFEIHLLRSLDNFKWDTHLSASRQQHKICDLVSWKVLWFSWVEALDIYGVSPHRQTRSLSNTTERWPGDYTLTWLSSTAHGTFMYSCSHLRTLLRSNARLGGNRSAWCRQDICNTRQLSTTYHQFW